MSISKQDINDHADNLKRLERSYKKHLKPLGVAMPGGNMQIGLVLLYSRLGQLVHKNDLADYVRSVKDDDTISGDQQLRHLRAKGWAINGSGRGEYCTNHDSSGEKIPSGHYLLTSITAPHTIWDRGQIKTRKGTVPAEDFETLLELYEHKCGVCGKDLSHGGADKGHQDPRKGFVTDNIIPLCTSCNNFQGDSYIINDSGRIIGLATPKLVMKSDKTVQRKIYLKLKAKFDD